MQVFRYLAGDRQPALQKKKAAPVKERPFL
jgi:hypothetical protein